VQAVGVLVGIDGQQRRFLVELARQRKLHDVGVHGRVVVEALDHGVQLGLGDVGGQLFVNRRDADFTAVADLGAYVAVRCRVVADEDRAEPRLQAFLGDPDTQVVLDLFGQRLTVQ